MTIATLLFFSTFLLGFIQTHHFRRLKYAPKFLPPSKISDAASRYAPYPSVNRKTDFAISYMSSPGALKQREQEQNYRLAEPIPAVYTYADQRDFSPFQGNPPVEAVKPDQDNTVSEISGDSLYEAHSYQPMPAPRTGMRPPVPESISLEDDDIDNDDDGGGSEISNSQMDEIFSPEEPNEHEI